MTRDEVIALVGRLDRGARIAFRDDGPPMVFPSSRLTEDGLTELWRSAPDIRVSFGPDSPLWAAMTEAMRDQDASGLPGAMRAAGWGQLP